MIGVSWVCDNIDEYGQATGTAQPWDYGQKLASSTLQLRAVRRNKLSPNGPWVPLLLSYQLDTVVCFALHGKPYLLKGIQSYRIPENFRGRKLSWNWFAENTFMGQWHVDGAYVHALLNSRRKLSQIVPNPQNLQKFSCASSQDLPIPLFI